MLNKKPVIYTETGRGRKVCNSCNCICHVKNRLCPNCGASFKSDVTVAMKVVPTAKQPAIYTEPGRGRKSCPSCNVIIHVKNRVCPKCQHNFANKTVDNNPPTIVAAQPEPRKRRRRRVKIGPKFERIDWKSLVRGDIIKVRGGGPYMLINGEKHRIGYSGHFRVHNLEHDGISAYPTGRKTKESGHCFITMVNKEKPSKAGVFCRRHNLVKVKEKC